MCGHNLRRGRACRCSPDPQADGTYDAVYLYFDLGVAGEHWELNEVYTELAALSGKERARLAW